MRQRAVFFLSVSLCVCFTASSLAATGDFLGVWDNVDCRTSSITRFEISPTGVGDELRVRTYASCTPTDCDWGSEEMDLYGGRPGNSDYQFATAVYDTRVARTILTFEFLDDGRLAVDSYRRYHAAGRVNYHAFDLFRRVKKPGPKPDPEPDPDPEPEPEPNSPPVAANDDWIGDTQPACLLNTCSGSRSCTLNAPAGTITANDSDPDPGDNVRSFINGNIPGRTCTAQHLCTTDNNFISAGSSLVVNQDGGFDLTYKTSQNFISGGHLNVVIAEFRYFLRDDAGAMSNEATVMIPVYVNGSCP